MSPALASGSHDNIGAHLVQFKGNGRTPSPVAPLRMQVDRDTGCHSTATRRAVDTAIPLREETGSQISARLLEVIAHADF